MTNPYSGLGDEHFWRRAVSNIEPHALDPVVSSKFRIENTDRVATAGSCFAQHISRKLSAIGFNFFIPESGAELSPEERERLGYGVFSARFGNIYTVRQLLQLLQESLGTRPKSKTVWARDDGRYVDPFRPNIEPDGFHTQESVHIAREKHLGHVRDMFRECDVFVFTLGLTEGWSDIASGDIFPLAPGVAGGSYNPDIHRFVNFNVNEVLSDLTIFLTLLKSVNPKVRVLLTVSPVPLIATFETRHVLVATSYSKSVLRVAAEQATMEFNWVDYFPSFEIITCAPNANRYFGADLREISAAGVAHAMRCFLKNYAGGPESTASRPPEAERVLVSQTYKSSAELLSSGVMCDEEMIDKVSF